jgi:hypothetical protein
VAFKVTPSSVVCLTEGGGCNKLSPALPQHLPPDVSHQSVSVVSVSVAPVDQSVSVADQSVSVVLVVETAVVVPPHLAAE